MTAERSSEYCTHCGLMARWHHTQWHEKKRKKTCHQPPSLRQQSSEKAELHILKLPSAASHAQHRLSAAARATAAPPLRSLVLTRFPFPIAFGYGRTIQPDNAATALKNLCYTYTATLRIACLVLLSEFLRGPDQRPAIAKAVRETELLAEAGRQSRIERQRKQSETDLTPPEPPPEGGLTGRIKGLWSRLTGQDDTKT